MAKSKNFQTIVSLCDTMVEVAQSLYREIVSEVKTPRDLLCGT